MALMLAGATWLGSQGASLAISPDPAATLPEDVAYVILTNNRPEVWQSLERYALFQQLSLLWGDTIQPPVPSFLPLTLDYGQAIAPWVGDTVATALLPLGPQTPTATALDNSWVMVAPVAQVEAVGVLLPLVIASRTDEPRVECDGGIPIYFWPATATASEPVEPDAPEPDAPEPDAPEPNTPEPEPSASDFDALEPEPPESAPSESSSSAAPISPLQATLNNGLCLGQRWLSPLALESSPLSTLTDKAEHLEDHEGEGHGGDDGPGVPEVGEQPEGEVPQPGMAIAILPEYVVAARSPVAIQRWLAQRPATAATSLAATPRYQRTLEDTNPATELGKVHGNLGELVKYLPAFEADLALPPVPLPPLLEDFTLPELTRLAAFQLDSTLSASLVAQPQGLRMQGRLHYDNSVVLRRELRRLAPADPTVLNWVPASTLALVTGQNLAGWLQEVDQFLVAQDPPFMPWILGRGFLASVLEPELTLGDFAWMDGGFTVFLFPTRETPLTYLFPQLQVGLGLGIQTSDRPKAEAVMAQLDEIIGTEWLTVEQGTLGGQPASAWQATFDPEAEEFNLLGHGWAAEDVLMVTLGGGALEPLVTANPRQTLPQSTVFQRTTDAFPTPNQGYVYTNLSATVSLLNQAFVVLAPESLEPESDSPAAANDFWPNLFRTLQTASASFSIGPEALQVDAMVLLAPAPRDRPAVAPGAEPGE